MLYTCGSQDKGLTLLLCRRQQRVPPAGLSLLEGLVGGNDPR